ncbi:MAG TPA: acetyl-CoA C-acetyltransferase [Candidatus Limnocylindrales bacterium]|nr:acetyl-CoA C-acetyltransferase [Candidatus Limnocylindrales bacterium]
MKEVVIISAARTPIGSFNGSLSSIKATKLGSLVIEEAIRRAGISKDLVDEVIMGNVLSAGLGQAPARQAALGAGLPPAVSALTINKVCASGLKAVVLAAQAVALGDAQVVVAGGMENMSQAPYALDRARNGYRMGHGRLLDLMIWDGLWDVYNDFHMGNTGELVAEKYGIGRREQDEYALQSYQRALQAIATGKFKKEIVPVEVPQKKGDRSRQDHPTFLFDTDEDPRETSLEQLAQLKPAFKENGTITAGNAPGISDGAAAVVVTSREKAEELGIRPLASIVGYATGGLAPEWVMMAPVVAVRKVLEKTGLSLDDIDLVELNEAFSVAVLAVCRELGLSLDKVNVNGGAVALGHPIGATGARILTTLLYEMMERDVRTGLVTLCLGGGNAVAMVVKR